MNFVFIILVLCILSYCSADDVAVKKKKKATKKSTKDWSKLNFDDIEKDWEDGDESEELMSGYDEHMRTMEINKKKKGKKRMNKKFDPNDAAALREMVSDMKLGGTPDQGVMVFVSLKQINPKTGKDWTSDDVEMLAGRWSALVKTASLQADFFNIGKDKKAEVLINIQKPWFYQGIMRFLAEQPETLKVTKDSKDYYPEEMLAAIEEEEY